MYFSYNKQSTSGRNNIGIKRSKTVNVTFVVTYVTYVATLCKFAHHGPYSQNSQICQIFLTIGHIILRFLRLKVFFKANVIRS